MIHVGLRVQSFFKLKITYLQGTYIFPDPAFIYALDLSFFRYTKRKEILYGKKKNTRGCGLRFQEH